MDVRGRRAPREPALATPSTSNHDGAPPPRAHRPAAARRAIRASVEPFAAGAAIGSATPVTCCSSMPSTSMPSRSGASSSSAWRTASSSVADDAWQELQLPCRRSRATPSSIPAARRRRRATPCTGARGRAPAARAPRATPDRGRGSAAGSRRPGRRRARRAPAARPRARPSCARAPRRTSRRRPRSAPGRSASPSRRPATRARPSAPGPCRSDPGRPRLLRPCRRRVDHLPDLAAPVYMCTPHGRHGSKDLTARMMSTPLKFSGPFSSKIGVFCTASS